MPSPDLDAVRRDLVLAQRAALAGARLALPYFSRVRELLQERKADGTIVTEADRAVEQTVRATLLAERPDDACLGEETGESGGGARRWILDGIDGTAVFVLGDTSWQSLIALEVDGEITVGVAIAPARGQIWWAARGLGAFVADFEGDTIQAGRRLRVAPAPDSLASTRLGIVPVIAMLDEHRRPPVERLVERLLRVTPPRAWPIHPALVVAEGDLDLAVQVLGSVWDFAALSLIVEEAGGAFSGLAGQGHPVSGTAIFASGDGLRRQALSQLG
jgi:histidinol-phosphatase